MPNVQSKTKNHFEKVDEHGKKVQCKLCNAVLTTGGGTSNMLSYLKRKQSDIMRQTDSPMSSDTNNTIYKDVCTLEQSSNLNF